MHSMSKTTKQAIENLTLGWMLGFSLACVLLTIVANILAIA